MSFLLNGEKMRERLAQILVQAQEGEGLETQKNDRAVQADERISRTGAFE